MPGKIAASINSQLEIPVIMAPMFLVSGPDLVIAGCKAGIVGSFPLSNARTLEDLEKWMTRITGELMEARNKDPASKIAPWAVNVAVHRTNRRLEEEIEIIRKFKPPIVITSLGDPSRAADIVHEYGGILLADVVTLTHARKAAQRGADGLILVCSGAGGHGGTINPFAFIGEVRTFWDGITILAGSISNGRDTLAAKVLGADFAYMGTRFIAAAESLAGRDYQNMLIESTVDDILYTDVFSGVPANYLIPSIRRAGYEPDRLPTRESFDWSRTKENGPKPWKDIWSAGHSVGRIRKVQPTAEIVSELKEEYFRLMKE